MKGFIKLVLVLLFVSCTVDELHDQDFVCTVDYIEFDTNGIARVKFDVEYAGLKDSYILEQTLVADGTDYYIGDNLVNIKGFTAKGSNEATFTFEYGENLGPFCVELFSAIPMHTHDNFAAEAERVITGKATGRWKIKKKTTLN